MSINKGRSMVITLIMLAFIFTLSLNLVSAAEEITHISGSYSGTNISEEKTHNIGRKQAQLTEVSIMALNDNYVTIDGTKMNLTRLEFYESDYFREEARVYRNKIGRASCRERV